MIRNIVKFSLVSALLVSTTISIASAMDGGNSGDGDKSQRPQISKEALEKFMLAREMMRKQHVEDPKDAPGLAHADAAGEINKTDTELAKPIVFTCPSEAQMNATIVQTNTPYVINNMGVNFTATSEFQPIGHAMLIQLKSDGPITCLYSQTPGASGSATASTAFNFPVKNCTIDKEHYISKGDFFGAPGFDVYMQRASSGPDIQITCERAD